MRYQFPHKKSKKHKKDILDTPLEEIKEISAEKILEDFQMIIYSKQDIAQINEGLTLIRNVLNKNNNKLRR